MAVIQAPAVAQVIMVEQGLVLKRETAKTANPEQKAKAEALVRTVQ